MTNTQAWESFRDGEFVVPTPKDVMFIAPGSTDADKPLWVTLPEASLPLVGRVVLAGEDNLWLVQPPCGELVCIKGRPVKITEAAKTVRFHRHVAQFQRSSHTKQEVVQLATSLLVTNRRPDDAESNTFVEFTRCEKEVCGYTIRTKEVRVEKGALIPENVFYVTPEKSGPIEKFLTDNSCLCVFLHNN